MAMEQQEEKATLSSLPDEINLKILNYLSVNDLVNVASVSQNLNRLATDDTLWSNLSTQASLETAEKTQDLSWREFYKDELKPNLVRFSLISTLKGPFARLHYYFDIKLMGSHVTLAHQSDQECIRYPDLVSLTKDQLRKNYECVYSVVSIRDSGREVCWIGRENIKAALLEKSLLLDNFHEIEALKLVLDKNYGSGNLYTKFRQQSPGKS